MSPSPSINYIVSAIIAAILLICSLLFTFSNVAMSIRSGRIIDVPKKSNICLAQHSRIQSAGGEECSFSENMNDFKAASTNRMVGYVSANGEIPTKTHTMNHKHNPRSNRNSEEVFVVKGMSAIESASLTRYDQIRIRVSQGTSTLLIVCTSLVLALGMAMTQASGIVLFSRWRKASKQQNVARTKRTDQLAYSK